MNGMQRDELDDCCLMTCVRFTAGGWENGRLDNFFAWGGSNMWHPPVPLIEDDCAA